MVKARSAEEIIQDIDWRCLSSLREFKPLFAVKVKYLSGWFVHCVLTSEEIDEAIAYAETQRIQTTMHSNVPLRT